MKSSSDLLSLGFIRRAQLDKSNLRKGSPSNGKVFRRLYPVPQRYIMLEDDFGRERVLASPLPSLQLPVISAYTRAKDMLPLSGVSPDPCHKSGNHKHPAAAGFFLDSHRASRRNKAVSQSVRTKR